MDDCAENSSGGIGRSGGKPGDSRAGREAGRIICRLTNFLHVGRHVGQLCSGKPSREVRGRAPRRESVEEARKWKQPWKLRGDEGRARDDFESSSLILGGGGGFVSCVSGFCAWGWMFVHCPHTLFHTRPHTRTHQKRTHGRILHTDVMPVQCQCLAGALARSLAGGRCRWWRWWWCSS